MGAPEPAPAFGLELEEPRPISDIAPGRNDWVVAKPGKRIE